MDKYSDYKTIYIIDPVKGERLHLAKFIMQDNFSVMSFVNISDCFNKSHALFCDLVIIALRKGKSDLDALQNIKEKYKNKPFIFLSTADSPDLDMEALKNKGYKSLYKASSKEEVREITLSHLAPDGIKTRPETPHPVPLPGEQTAR